MSDDETMSAIELETDDNDGEYHPRGSPIPPVESSPSGAGKQQRKRGRKPNPNQSIRSAREAARKANHSVIEYVVYIVSFSGIPVNSLVQEKETGEDQPRVDGTSFSRSKR